MKLSIIIPVLNSHEIVRRQTIHFQKCAIDNALVEILFIDDGSDPPIESPYVAHRTNDKRPWTWALARNIGADISHGNYLLMTDLDYIIPKSVIEKCLEFTGEYMGFKREFGILDENGKFMQDIETLIRYGWPVERYVERGFFLPPHPNNFLIRKDLFYAMGKYREDLVEKPYPQGEDRHWKKERMRWEKAGKLHIDWKDRPTIYMFPNGQWCVGEDVDSDPLCLFHNLSRKTNHNYWYKKQNERAIGNNSSQE